MCRCYNQLDQEQFLSVIQTALIPLPSKILNILKFKKIVSVDILPHSLPQMTEPGVEISHKTCPNVPPKHLGSETVEIAQKYKGVYKLKCF